MLQMIKNWLDEGIDDGLKLAQSMLLKHNTLLTLGRRRTARYPESTRQDATDIADHSLLPRTSAPVVQKYTQTPP
jgi:hypothetical protein